MNKLIYDIKVEQRVLSSLMGTRKYYDSVSSQLNEECFYDSKNLATFKGIKSLVDQGNDPEMYLVYVEAKKVDPTYEPSDITKYGESAIDLPKAVAVLNWYRKRREAQRIGNKLIHEAERDDVEIDEVLLSTSSTLSDSIAVSDYHDTTFNTAVNEVITQINENRSSTKVVTGTPVGFSFIDSKGGFHEDDLIIVAGASSMGKTSLTLSMCINALKNGSSCAIYSMEMSQKQLCARILSTETGISSSDILYQSLLDMETNRISAALGNWIRIGDNLHFDDRSGSDIEMIMASIRNKHKKFGIKGAVIDYLQILNVNMKNSTNKEQAMGNIARQLKNLAKELHIWIVALSQLNRDRMNPVPSIDRLRDSGQIAEAADTVILVYRPEQMKMTSYPYPYSNASVHNTAWIDIAKGRNTGTGVYIVGFEPPTTHFFELDQPVEMDSEDMQSKELLTPRQELAF